MYAEKALDQAPDQASILDTYGYIAFLQNDFKTAIPVLEKAYIANHSPKTGARLATALYLTGDNKKFISLTKQLQLDFPQHAEVIKLNTLLRPQSLL
ncbi:hypothetical protein SAMN05421733_10468 [Acinetobacter boissieri]|uniref:Uncharacterized protein n=1 Tax=Acinetobacter boissieri TaxID=1219383 RepID=A0A1G6H6J2_9GAMM|nr:hypothetical protein SAMN05421733_10468 [Acinetobacter boissieri]